MKQWLGEQKFADSGKKTRKILQKMHFFFEALILQHWSDDLDAIVIEIFRIDPP